MKNSAFYTSCVELEDVGINLHVRYEFYKGMDRFITEVSAHSSESQVDAENKIKDFIFALNRAVYGNDGNV